MVQFNGDIETAFMTKHASEYIEESFYNLKSFL